MRKAVLLAGFLLAAWLGLAQDPPAAPPPPPPQPIPYSHKLHAGTLKLQCSFCHENQDPGEMMGIPASAKCMGCHKGIKTDSPHIQKLAGYHAQNRPVPWLRVYQIPSYVFFSHREHTKAGNTCTECHGPVAERDVLAREVPINMGACMDCHQKKKAPNDCGFCHEQRN
jgi:hypothetical protein